MARRAPQGGGPEYSPEERREIMVRFLRHYAKTGVLSYSADYAGTTVKTIRRWLKNYPKFKEKFEEMQDRFVDSLEMVAIERAREKSDTLMSLLLRANRPEKYRDNIKMDADVKNQHAPIQLVFSRDEWGDDELPNYAGGEDDEQKEAPSESDE